MADQPEVQMSKTEYMESARNVLSAAAVSYMARGGLPESGTGTIVTDDNGTQHIAGINDGFSRINWSETPSKTASALTTKETSDFGNSKLVHTQTKDANNPNKYQDELTQILSNGKVSLDMKGQCEVSADGSQHCSYEVKSSSGSGTADITTSKETINKEYEVWMAKSKIDVKTENGDVSADLTYKVSGDVAAYDYKNVTPKGK